QALLVQHLVDPGHAAGEVVGDVEDGGVDLDQVGGQGEEVLGDRVGRAGGVRAGDQLDRGLRAHGPLAQQAAAGAHLAQLSAGPGSVGGEQIVHDGVVVAGQHRDLVPTVVGQQLLQHVIGAVAVEG